MKKAKTLAKSLKDLIRNGKKDNILLEIKAIN